MESIQYGGALETDERVRGRALTLGAFLRETSSVHSSHEAVVTNDARTSYGGLEERARAVARELIASGGSKATKVAIYLPNGVDWIASFFGVTTIGSIAIALNTFARDADLEDMLLRSDTEFLLTNRSMFERLANTNLAKMHPIVMNEAQSNRDLALPAFRSTILVDDTIPRRPRAVPDDLVDALADRVAPDDDAMIMFTSGSTGRPKAVLHSHRAVCVQSWRWAVLEGHTQHDRVWTTSPFFWSSGLVRAMGGTLAAGATLVLQERFEPSAALALLERERVSSIISRPHLDQRLAAAPDFDPAKLSTIVRVSDQSPLWSRLGIPEAPGSRGAYGLTETMTIATYESSDTKAEVGHGRVLPGLEIRIVDVESGKTTMRGVQGRITLRGETVMRGYYGQSRSESFDPDGYFATSDSGYLDQDGRLHFTGRLDNVVKVAGVNVSPTDIERHLIGWDVLDAYSAFPLPHPTLGAALVLCAAFSKKALANGASEATIRDHLHQSLATYQMPKAIVIVDAELVPLTSTLKVNVAAMQTLGVARLRTHADAEWVRHLDEMRTESEVTPPADKPPR